VYIGDEGGLFYALRASDGKALWKLQTGDKIASSAVCVNGRVLFGSYDTHLYCLDARTGRKRWTFTTEAQVHATACVADHRIMISGCDGFIRVISLTTGRQLARYELGGNIGASCALDDGQVFVGNLDGIYVCLRAQDAHGIWKVQEREEQAACYSSAAPFGDTVVFGSRSRRIFAVSKRSGRGIWTFRTRGEVNASPLISGPVVYAPCDDGCLYALDVRTGREIWRYQAGGKLAASPAIGEGRLVIGSTDGSITCFGK
jgi:outer membrane protein assembly factor BamB